MPVTTIKSLAEGYADIQLEGRRLSPRAQAVLRNRHIYNFEAVGFNLSTVATVVAVALTVFLSPLFAILAVASFVARQAFKDEVDQTGIPFLGKVISQLGPDLDDPIREFFVKATLGVSNEEWHPVRHQFLSRLWMSHIPSSDPIGSPNPRVLFGSLQPFLDPNGPFGLQRQALGMPDFLQAFMQGMAMPAEAQAPEGVNLPPNLAQPPGFPPGFLQFMQAAAGLPGAQPLEGANLPPDLVDLLNALQANAQ